MTRIFLPMALAALGLAACVPDDGSVPSEAPDTCGKAELEFLVGMKQEAYDFEALNQPVRIIPQGGAMTMDYRFNRLNVELGEAGEIKRLFCG